MRGLMDICGCGSDLESADLERGTCAVCEARHLRMLLDNAAWCADPRRGARPHPLTGVLERDAVRAELEALSEEPEPAEYRSEEQEAREADLSAYEEHVDAAISAGGK